MTAVLDYTSAGPFTCVDGVNLPAGRFDENQIRPASVLLEWLLSLDPAPVTTARGPGKRVVGTCRHFAVLSCAFLRYRCGFATYFQPGRGVDHWITEYWDGAGARWIRMTDAYHGKTGADYDVLLDDIAEVCAADDPVAVRTLYEHDDLRVPDKLIRF